MLQSEPEFDQLGGQEEDRGGESTAARTSTVTFSRVIEVRHRKSWSEWVGVGKGGWNGIAESARRNWCYCVSSLCFR